MASSNKQPKWDICEAVILLEGYIESLQSSTPKHQIIKRISKDLRKLANNRGVKIDDVFRNENGISYQIKSMESAFKRQKIYVSSTKLFDEIVDIYNSNREKYFKLLEEAKGMIDNEIKSESDLPSKDVSGVSFADTPEKLDDDLLSAAEIIIPEKFPNGIRKSSQIARKKFCASYKELTGDEFPDTVEIDELALAVGVEYEDKIYVPSKKIKKFILESIYKARNDGYGVIFYEEFYNAFSNILAEDGIFSSDLLMKMFKQMVPSMSFYKTYVGFTSEDNLVNDIVRAYRNDLYLNYHEIKNRLPYADFYQIRLTCSRNSKFVSMGEEVYVLADRMHISENDIDNAKKSIAKDIERNSFSMLNNISVDESEGFNPGISPYALKTLLFDKYLSDLYTRRRSLITQAGLKIRMYDVMKDYCLEFERITVEEIEAYEREVSGNFAYGLNAAFDSMIRIDKDTFIHRDLASFDIDATDRAISLYVQNNIYPIADITSFTSFPYLEGYTWNVFLLDSFCSHYSKKYRSLGGPAQKGIIGAIYPVNMQFSTYSELLAQVAADSGLELTDDIINNYFSKHKYLLRRCNINEVLAKAQEIRFKEG